MFCSIKWGRKLGLKNFDFLYYVHVGFHLISVATQFVVLVFCWFFAVSLAGVMHHVQIALLVVGEQ